jgi:hypothetical protein
MALTDNQKVLLFIVAVYIVYKNLKKQTQQTYCSGFTRQTSCNLDGGNCYWAGTNTFGSCKSL